MQELKISTSMVAGKNAFEIKDTRQSIMKYLSPKEIARVRNVSAFFAHKIPNLIEVKVLIDLEKLKEKDSAYKDWVIGGCGIGSIILIASAAVLFKIFGISAKKEEKMYCDSSESDFSEACFNVFRNCCDIGMSHFSLPCSENPLYNTDAGNRTCYGVVGPLLKGRSGNPLALNNSFIDFCVEACSLWGDREEWIIFEFAIFITAIFMIVASCGYCFYHVDRQVNCYKDFSETLKEKLSSISLPGIELGGETKLDDLIQSIKENLCDDFSVLDKKFLMRKFLLILGQTHNL